MGPSRAPPWRIRPAAHHPYPQRPRFQLLRPQPRAHASSCPRARRASRPARPIPRCGRSSAVDRETASGVCSDPRPGGRRRGWCGCCASRWACCCGLGQRRRRRRWCVESRGRSAAAFRRCRGLRRLRLWRQSGRWRSDRWGCGRGGGFWKGRRISYMDGQVVSGLRQRYAGLTWETRDGRRSHAHFLISPAVAVGSRPSVL